MPGPSGATARLALPYPIPDDSADVPRDIQALAVKLDAFTSVQAPLVAALPGAPVDGQECYFQNAAMATDGIVWHLRYRAASPSPYKWEVLSGTPLQAAVTADLVVATGWTAGGLSLTLPLAGTYGYRHGARIGNNAVGASGRNIAGLYVAGVEDSNSYAEYAFANPGGGVGATVSVMSAGVRNWAAGATVAQHYYAASTANTFGLRWVELMPRRVG